MKEFSIKETLKFGWQKTKENLWFLIGLQIVLFAIDILSGESVVGMLIGTLVGVIFISVLLRISQGEKVIFKNLFEGITVNKFLHYLIASILVGLFVFVGFVLLIVPGFIIAMMTCFTTFIILEKNSKSSFSDLTFWRAIKESKKITNGYKWKLFKYFLVVILVNILGMIALGVGIFISLPVTVIGFTHIYNQLKNNPTVEPEVIA